VVYLVSELMFPASPLTRVPPLRARPPRTTPMARPFPQADMVQCGVN